MKKVWFSVYTTTFVLVIYTIFTRIDWLYTVSLTLFFVLHILLIWMIWTVLVKGEESKYTFEERFYDDMTY